MAQKSQNLELGNFTEALAAARTRAMDNLTRSAMRPGGNGVVQVSITDERLSFAPRIVSFVAWGTTIRSVDRSARTAGAVPVVNLMDETFGVEATALSRRFRGG